MFLSLWYLAFRSLLQLVVVVLRPRLGRVGCCRGPLGLVRGYASHAAWHRLHLAHRWTYTAQHGHPPINSKIRELGAPPRQGEPALDTGYQRITGKINGLGLRVALRERMEKGPRVRAF